MPMYQCVTSLAVWPVAVLRSRMPETSPVERASTKDFVSLNCSAVDFGVFCETTCYSRWNWLHLIWSFWIFQGYIRSFAKSFEDVKFCSGIAIACS